MTFAEREKRKSRAPREEKRSEEKRGERTNCSAFSRIGKSKNDGTVKLALPACEGGWTTRRTDGVLLREVGEEGGTSVVRQLVRRKVLCASVVVLVGDVAGVGGEDSPRPHQDPSERRRRVLLNVVADSSRDRQTE